MWQTYNIRNSGSSQIRIQGVRNLIKRFINFLGKNILFHNFYKFISDLSLVGNKFFFWKKNYEVRRLHRKHAKFMEISVSFLLSKIVTLHGQRTLTHSEYTNYL